MTPAQRQRALVGVFAQHSREFEWGSFDCVTLAIDVVAALRGARLLEPTWRSREEAESEIARRGGLASAVSAVLGPAYDPSAVAPLDGDVVLIRRRAFEQLAIWAGGACLGRAASGLHRFDTKYSAAAWRV